MSLPISQVTSISFSGSVVANTTQGLINAITGMMFNAGWTTTGAGVLRCVTDDQNRFFEMEVLQNTTPSLSNQVQFAVYSTTKAANNTAFVNRGFQITTGQAYKIWANPYSVYAEHNDGTLGNGNHAFAFQLYANPLTSGVAPSALVAGGHRDFAGSAVSLAYFYQSASTFNGTSGTIGGGFDMKAAMGAATNMAQFKGGRIFILEDWFTAAQAADQIFGRPYGVLVAGLNGGGGFDLPSGTGVISYLRLDAFSTNGSYNYAIRTV